MRCSWPCAVVLVAVAASSTRAHYDSITWSNVTVDADGSVDYRLQVPFEDLSEALGLRGHRPATVAEVRSGSDRLLAYFMAGVQVRAGDEPCRLSPGSVDNVEAAELRAELRFGATCPGAPSAISIEYDIFFDHDPSHLGLYVVHYPGGELRGEFSRSRRAFTVPLGAAGESTTPWGLASLGALLVAGASASRWRARARSAGA